MTLNYKIANEEDVGRLSDELKICPELASILVNRGIRTFDEAFRFFRPNLNELHDPFLFENMAAAVNLILTHTRSKVLIYGDYDVDGTTAVAIIFDFFKKHLKVKNLSYYVPDRNREGYGVSINAVRDAIANKVKLMLTLDCGIKDFEAIKLAEDHGIKVIVIDHHEEDCSIKHPASVVLDQKCHNCNYPFKELSGGGVAFKLVQAIVKKLSIDSNVLYEYLDLVALSTACDLVPIVGENRILLYHGLEKIKDNPRLGIKMLMGQMNKFRSVDVDFLVFDIGPKINASGRIDRASKSVDILISHKPSDARLLSEEINFLNTVRRNIDRQMLQEALKILEEESEERFCNIVYSPNWHTGLLGIVASKCVERFYRPTIVFSDKDDLLVGSARSVADFNLYGALEKCSKWLVSFGGHEFAAGLKIKKEDLSNFKQEFNNVVKEAVDGKQFVRVQDVDAKISLPQIDRKFLSILKQMEPFGNCFPKPIFESTVIVRDMKILKGEHVSLDVEEKGVRARGIGFFLREQFKGVKRGDMLRVFYNVQIEEFRNSFQMMVRHVLPVVY